MYEVVFYTTRRGDSPIDKFLDGLRKKARAKIEALIAFLEQQGPNLRRPYADRVRRKMNELRVVFAGDQFRILYFFFVRNMVVLLHGFTKKTQKLKESDIKIAEDRREDWVSRYGEGG